VINQEWGNTALGAIMPSLTYCSPNKQEKKIKRTEANILKD